MSDMDGAQLSPARRLNALVMDTAFFDRNSFDKEQVEQLLMDVLLQNHLIDQHLEAVVALSRAIRGTHPRMSIELRAVPDGVIPRPLQDIRKGAQTMEVADQIDMKVAHGIKQDAAIHEAMKHFSVSRREVFRMLKSARQRRKRMREQEEEFAEWDYWYDDYQIDKAGRLVPRENNS